MKKQLLADYFTFTKKERRGIIVLLVFIAFFIAVPFLYPFFIKTKKTDPSAFKEEIATLTMQQQDSAPKYTAPNYDQDNYQNYNQPSEKNYTKNFKGELFDFDPNTASVADWQRLGVRDKTIATIQNYLSKGGHFYKPEDMSKIWGLHPDEVERMIPYIHIAPKENNYPQKNFENKTFDKPKYTPTVIDVNTADTTAFIALPGIGSKLAQRIVTFRDKLGGFYTKDQIAETFGLQDSVFQKIKTRLKLTNSAVKQININTATMEEMKVHPYIRYNLANAIFQYRTQHGNFSSVAGVKNIMMVTDDLFNKVAPYLTIQ